MPIHYLPLTEEQKSFIIANHKKMTDRQLFKALHTCKRLVVEYMKENNLPIIEHSWKKEPETIAEGYFDYSRSRDLFIG